MEAHVHVSGAKCPSRVPRVDQCPEPFHGRASTYSIGTTYSARSDSASSGSFRFSRAPSLTSTCTSSSSSSRSTASWLTQSTHAQWTRQPQHESIPTRQTLREKQASNRYACSHCSSTFSKRADRKKHILSTCPFLGGGLLCDSCNHISRNKHQAERHWNDFGHESANEPILISKHAITCSNDGILYRSIQDYLEHFSDASCILNAFDGNRKHLSRLRTLLSEGRDDCQGHSHIYAALVRYCFQHGLTTSSCNAVVDAIPVTMAQRFAERLEWGIAPKEDVVRGRLGYTSFDEIIADIMDVGNRSVVQYQSGSTSSLRNARTTCRPSPPCIPAHSASSVSFRRKQIPVDPINTSRPFPPLPADKSVQTRTIHRLETVDHIDQDSPAVTAATDILRRHCIRPYVDADGPRATTRLHPRQSRHRQEAEEYARFSVHTEDDGENLDDWPEFHSLTPPPPHSATTSALAACGETGKWPTGEEDLHRMQQRQRRQAGIWDSSFDEFLNIDEWVLHDEDMGDDDRS